MKRILCILSSLDAGGAETFVMKVCRSLPTEEYQIDFIVSQYGGCYEQEVLARGGWIHKIPLRTKAPFQALSGIHRIVKENGYEYVLKLGETSVASLDLVAARLGGAKNLAMRSCNALTGLPVKKKVVNAVLRPVLNMVANVKLAPSMLAAEFTFGKKQAHRDVHLLHNGVDLKVFRFDPEGRNQIRNEFDISNRFIVGHVGRFHAQKNHRYLLEVFQKIREQRSDAVLLLVGIGDLEQKIRGWARELGLEDAVIFAGQRFDIPQLLSAMDVFVFPSLHEGMPNTVVEAQATGLPCVIADTITPEADLTGIVTYLPLTENKEDWVKTALSVAAQERRDTQDAFIAKGYDIKSVAQEFIALLGVEAVR